MSSPSPRNSLPALLPWLVAGVVLFAVAAFGGFGAAYIVASANAVPTVDSALLPTPSPQPTTTRPPVSPTPITSPAPTATPTAMPSAMPSGSGAATPSASSAPTPAPTPISYVVKRGDRLSSIAAQFGVTIQAIVDLNHLANPDHIEVGQILLIPVP